MAAKISVRGGRPVHRRIEVVGLAPAHARRRACRRTSTCAASARTRCTGSSASAAAARSVSAARRWLLPRAAARHATTVRTAASLQVSPRLERERPGGTLPLRRERYGWIVTGPVTGAAGAVHRRCPVAGDPERADHAVAVDLDAARVAGDAHRADDRVRIAARSPPTTTGPVLPVIVSGPVIVAPQIRTAAAPLAMSGPVILPPSTSSEPPAATVTGPVVGPPAPMQTASPAATAAARRRRPGQARAASSATVSVPATKVSNT